MNKVHDGERTFLSRVISSGRLPLGRKYKSDAEVSYKSFPNRSILKRV